MQRKEAAFGASALAAREEPLRIGMIGAGFIAQAAHLYAFSRISEARIVALAEPHDGLREAVARRFAIGTSTANYRDLLCRPDIDGVVICVPRRAQSLLVTEFISENQAVLSEKPMAMTLAEAEGMVEKAQRSGARWMVGYMKRHDRGVQRFARLLSELRASGELGEILHVGMRDFCAVYGIAKPEYIARNGARPIRYPESTAAPDFVPDILHSNYEYTINVASHDINLLRMFFGEGLTVTNFSIHPGGLQCASFDSSGIPISLVVGPADLGRWDQRIDVTFARGRASLILPSPLARQVSGFIQLESPGCKNSLFVTPMEHIWAFEAQARAFIDSIRSKSGPETSGVSSLADMALVDSLWRKVICK